MPAPGYLFIFSKLKYIVMVNQKFWSFPHRVFFLYMKVQHFSPFQTYNTTNLSGRSDISSLQKQLVFSCSLSMTHVTHAASITVKVMKPKVTFTSAPRVYSRFHHEFHTNSKIMKLLIRKYTDCSKRLRFHTHTHAK